MTHHCLLVYFSSPAFAEHVRRSLVAETAAAELARRSKEARGIWRRQVCRSDSTAMRYIKRMDRSHAAQRVWTRPCYREQRELRIEPEPRQRTSNGPRTAAVREKIATGMRRYWADPDQRAALTKRMQNRPRLQQCKRGHALSGYNVYIRKTSGAQMCRACMNLRKRRYRAAGRVA